jgi:large subunit ribosomal protein L6
MSRIGNKTISIPENVTVTINNRIATVKGPKGELNLNLPFRINVEVKDQKIIVSREGDDKITKSCHGSTRAHLQNMVTGVVTPWVKSLEIRGTGYKASVNDNKLTVIAGFIHPVFITAPEGITFQVVEDTKVIVTGPDKTVVGQVGSNIRKIKPPEPYKGKGIRYLGEFIKLKAGKTAKA